MSLRMLDCLVTEQTTSDRDMVVPRLRRECAQRNIFLDGLRTMVTSESAFTEAEVGKMKVSMCTNVGGAGVSHPTVNGKLAFLTSIDAFCSNYLNAIV